MSDIKYFAIKTHPIGTRANQAGYIHPGLPGTVNSEVRGNLTQRKLEAQDWGQYKKVSEYDQVIPQSHTAVQPTAPRGRATEHL